mgnify:CR=1 FL=1
MAINSLETAKRYTDELDKAIVQKAVTGFFADNIFRAKFAGAKTVIMPDISFVGLADYNRDSGFSLAGTTIGNTSYTLTKDRGRKLQIDREDMDETGVANLAGQVLGEYVRTQVVPEMDAYVLSKLAKVASDKSHKTTYAAAKAASQLATAINNVQSRVGYGEELVAFCDPTFYAQLMNSTEFSRNIVVSDFAKGGLNTRVKFFNGVALIPVTEDRMREEYDFKAGTAATSSAAATGGFAPKANTGYTRALVIPKKGASLVKKTETLRIFTPEQNIDADAYAFNYRLYYDVFVKKSKLDGIETIVTAGTASS